MELFIWCCFAVGCALVAQKKNRSAGGWFVGGIFFGVFALILLFLLPAVNVQNSIAMRRCPHCDEEISINAKVCKHCGKDVL